MGMRGSSLILVLALRECFCFDLILLEPRGKRTWPVIYFHRTASIREPGEITAFYKRFETNSGKFK